MFQQWLRQRPGAPCDCRFGRVARTGPFLSHKAIIIRIGESERQFLQTSPMDLTQDPCRVVECDGVGFSFRDAGRLSASESASSTDKTHRRSNVFTRRSASSRGDMVRSGPGTFNDLQVLRSEVAYTFQQILILRRRFLQVCRWDDSQNVEIAAQENLPLDRRFWRDSPGACFVESQRLGSRRIA